MSRSRSARIVGLLVIAGALVACGRPPWPGGGGGHNRPPVDVQILGLNDFHGNLEPPAGSGGRIGDGTTSTPAASTTSPRTSRTSRRPTPTTPSSCRPAT